MVRVSIGSQIQETQSTTNAVQLSPLGANTVRSKKFLVALAALKTLLTAAIESKSKVMPESFVATWRSVSFSV